jgi:hypothetical protein
VQLAADLRDVAPHLVVQPAHPLHQRRLGWTGSAQCGVSGWNARQPRQHAYEYDTYQPLLQ